MYSNFCTIYAKLCYNMRSREKWKNTENPNDYKFLEFPAILEDDTPLWKNDCKITEITDGAACTGSIIDNGGKVVYAY